MLRPIPEYKKSGGFSLLELIIVLVILGVVVAAITLSISDSRHDKLRLEARRLAARLTLAMDEAIITNQEFGLEVSPDSYQFLMLVEERWQPVATEGERQLVEQQLPEGMEIQLRVDGLYAQFQQETEFNRMFKEYDDTAREVDEEDAEEQSLRPQIYLMSSGEMNAFSLLIGYDNEEPVFYQLNGTFDGKVQLEGPVHDSMSYAIGALQ